MALDLTPEQKATGKANFEQAAGDLARAGKMRLDGRRRGTPIRSNPTVATFSRPVSPPGRSCRCRPRCTYGYDSWKGNKAVRTALIGSGDEGGVLIGDHNPEFNEIVAVCDIRPSNQKRIFEGEPPAPRKGLNKVYGDETAKKIGEVQTPSTNCWPTRRNSAWKRSSSPRR